MKQIVNFVLTCVPLACFGQFSTPELFGEYTALVEEQVEENIYHKITLGSQLTSYKFIAPEIEVSYNFGAPTQEQIARAAQSGEATYQAYLNTFFEGFMWGVAPKLFYDNEGTRFVFIPKYHFGTLRAEGSVVDTNAIFEEQEAKIKIDYWSFALGIEEHNWSPQAVYAFYLYYTRFNAGEAVNSLDFTNLGFDAGRLNTRTVGLSFRVSYNFKKKETI